MTTIQNEWVYKELIN